MTHFLRSAPVELFDDNKGQRDQKIFLGAKAVHI